MFSRYPRIFAVVLTALALPILAVAAFIERGFTWLCEKLVPAFDGITPRLDTGTGLPFDGNPLDSALQQSLRHEAGMRPLRC